MATPEPLALLRLLQLTSPALPIGAYNFSQGLEWAVEAGWVTDEDSVHAWCRGLLHHSLGTLDLPLLVRLRAALDADDTARARALSAQLLAARETAELRAEERHLARALAKVLLALGEASADDWLHCPQASYAALFALAARRGGIEPQAMCQGYLWSWCENQLLAALKLLPLGQSAGQRVLDRLLREIPALAAQALQIADDDIGSATPRAVMAAAWHETQYSRLFRS